MRTPIFIDNMNPGGADATSEHANVAHVHHPSKFFDKFFASIYLSICVLRGNFFFFRPNPQQLLVAAHVVHQHRELVVRRAGELMVTERFERSLAVEPFGLEALITAQYFSVSQEYNV